MAAPATKPTETTSTALRTEWNEIILQATEGYLGLKEWPGAKSNPEVEALFKAAGFPGLTDDVPWCAGFVGAVLAQVGLKPSGSLMARSYLKWGMDVPIHQARPGDVVVFARGKPPSAHVAFFLWFDGTRVKVRGGNQSDAVTDAFYPVNDILKIRRADPSSPTDRTTIKRGDANGAVIDLQTRLRMLGYFQRSIDGNFGPLTDASVRAFQADQRLVADGVVGPRTWEALDNAEPRPKHKEDEKTLKAKGSTTIANADQGTIAVLGAGAAATLPPVAETINTAVQQAQGIIPTIHMLLRDHWQIILVGAALWFVWRAFQKIKAARVKAAVNGENLSR